MVSAFCFLFRAKLGEPLRGGPRQSSRRLLLFPSVLAFCSCRASAFCWQCRTSAVADSNRVRLGLGSLAAALTFSSSVIKYVFSAGPTPSEMNPNVFFQRLGPCQCLFPRCNFLESGAGSVSLPSCSLWVVAAKRFVGRSCCLGLMELVVGWRLPRWSRRLALLAVPSARR